MWWDSEPLVTKPREEFSSKREITTPICQSLGAVPDPQAAHTHIKPRAFISIYCFWVSVVHSFTPADSSFLILAMACRTSWSDNSAYDCIYVCATEVYRTTPWSKQWSLFQYLPRIKPRAKDIDAHHRKFSPCRQCVNTQCTSVINFSHARANRPQLSVDQQITGVLAVKQPRP